MCIVFEEWHRSLEQKLEWQRKTNERTVGVRGLSGGGAKMDSSKSPLNCTWTVGVRGLSGGATMDSSKSPLNCTLYQPRDKHAEWVQKNVNNYMTENVICDLSGGWSWDWAGGVWTPHKRQRRAQIYWRMLIRESMDNMVLWVLGVSLFQQTGWLHAPPTFHSSHSHVIRQNVYTHTHTHTHTHIQITLPKVTIATKEEKA